MNYRAIFGIGLLSCAFSGCLSHSDTHPDIPLLPQTDNARIRVDSLPDTAVHGTESDRSKAFYESYALAHIRSGQSSFGYRGADGEETYVFTRVTADSTAVFRLDESVIQKSGVVFRKSVVNPRVTIDQTKSRYTDSEGKAIIDKTSALRLTEELQTQHNDFLLGGNKMDQFLVYYELKIGAQTAHFKWLYPVKLSDDSYLQSANGTVFLVKENTLCWFHE